jgi:double-stranded RNA-specific adenosine deaminase
MISKLPKNANGIRSAESNRTSSCLFADEVAKLCIETYRKICPEDICYSQTVIAGIVMENQLEQSLRVVSLGVGTKFLGKNTLSIDDQLKVIRDCHGEILARRAFLRFLYEDILNYLDSNSSELFEMKGDLLSTKEHIRFHLYSSSQPCGNATIKKWATSKRPIFDQSLSKYCYPCDIHSRLHVTARQEGQIALLVKKDKAIVTTNETEDSKYTEGSTLKRASSEMSKVLDCVENSLVVPVGTATVDSGLGSVMTCSDKIAKWNAIGIQGSLLSQYIEPIYLSTITVGRKFSKVHCERALCCRLQDFSYNERYRIHHPVMMGTAVKLDEGAIITSINNINTNSEDVFNSEVDMPLQGSVSETPSQVGAVFNEHRSLYWYDGNSLPQTQIVDSLTGKLFISNTLSADVLSNDISMPNICSYALFEEYLKIQEKIHLKQSDDVSTEKLYSTLRKIQKYNANDYLDVKDCRYGREYDLAKYELLSDRRFFKGWVSRAYLIKHE